MKHILMVLVLSLLLGQSCNRGKEGGHPRFDVLFIAIDDMNDWVNCLNGREGIHTPNIDDLMSRGMLFTNAHCTAPACCPSRTSVMTGVRPSTSGVYSNAHIWRESPVLATARTIPEYFREIGYTVKGGGKIFHALSWIRTGYGVDQNDPDIWDEYFPSKNRQMPESLWPETAVKDSTGYVTWVPLAGAGTENRPPHFFDYGGLGNTSDMADQKVVDWAIGELNRDRDKPLFLAVGIFRPHIPWFVPREFFDLYPLEEVELPGILENDLEDVSPVSLRWLRRSWQRWMIANDQWAKAVQAYQASISYSDYMVGKLIEGLEKSGAMENTVIVLWSDHGMHIGEKEQWEKFTLWEESTRVPLFISAPGITEKGSNSAEAVSLLDIFPTLVELTGTEVFPQLEGTSLLPLLKDPDLNRDEPAVTTYHYNNHSVRTENWRYIRYHNGDEELYDHRTDPDEFHNLAGQEKYRVLMDSLKQYLPVINQEE